MLSFLKIMSDNTFVVAYYNLFEEENDMLCTFADAGIPYASGYGFSMTDVFTSLFSSHNFHIKLKVQLSFDQYTDYGYRIIISVGGLKKVLRKERMTK